jgi:hypothetical protein
MSMENYKLTSSILHNHIVNFQRLPYEDRKNLLLPLQLINIFTTYESVADIGVGVYIVEPDSYYYFESKLEDGNDRHIIYFRKEVKTLADLSLIWNERLNKELEIKNL